MLNREFQNLQQNPPQYPPQEQPQSNPHNHNHQSKKIQAKDEENVPKKTKDDQPDMGRGSFCWLQAEETLLASCYVAVSEDPNIGNSQKKDTFWYKVLGEFNRQNFQKRNKDMLTSNEQVPGGGHEELFDEDPRPRPSGKARPAKKSKSEATTSTGGSNSSNPFGDMMSTEFRLKREAAKSAYEVAKEKDRTIVCLE
ncbi:hypothetical protein Tco_1058589 [Tanacetum coccineum]|uniref:No apical meristem-associated C-terminal domain-containing protein n=1 Tax=Tanacetum coccineum TaxID=301880 RepID=A0ABQ5HAH8_9ASTR